MKLDQVLAGIDYKISGGQVPQDIAGIAYDSRRVKKGFLFICIPGSKTDGHLFAKQAIANGATAILAEREIEVSGNCCLLLTDNCRKAMPVIAGNFYLNPSYDMYIIGVTGTNGKTTTTHLIKSILEENGQKTGILGTLYASIGDVKKEMGRTTPESLEIEEFLSFCRKEKAENVVMEVSSHALHLNRVDKLNFSTAVFTNLTQDHLDYHQSMEEYQKVKCQLFSMLTPAEDHFCIINNDDPHADAFIKAASSRVLTYGIHKNADIRVVNVQMNSQETRFTVQYQDKEFAVRFNLVGEFNVYNALAAISFALAREIEISVIQKALAQIKGVPGRFERVDDGQNFTVIVDYAHTPDGLENILKTGRKITANRLITVVGCGGDRDRSKRPLMGSIASRYSDFCIITSDNPRSEEPESIIDDIIQGITAIPADNFTCIADRRQAINYAVSIAQEGDLIIIAGKGHETYQIVKDKILEFDDREVAREALKGGHNNGNQH